MKKKKEITFGVDIDEVLRALVPQMVKIYNAEFGSGMTVDDVHDFVVDKSFPLVLERYGESASKWFFQDHGHDLFLCSPEIEGAREALKLLRSMGKVIIVSYQKSVENKMDTLAWLDHHKMEYDGICFVKDKTLIHTDYLIDDNDWNFIGSNAGCAVLVSAPYNKNTNLEKMLENSNCKEAVRVESLQDFVEYLK